VDFIADVSVDLAFILQDTMWWKYGTNDAQLFFIAGHSDTNNLAKCLSGFLKHNLFSVINIFITKSSTGNLGKSQDPQIARHSSIHTPNVDFGLVSAFALYSEASMPKFLSS
jgi:hypothetical protein